MDIGDTSDSGQGKPTFWDWLTRRIPSLLPGGTESETEEASVQRREQLLAFGLAILLGFFLWVLVNMSRTYTMVVPVLLKPGEVPEGMTLSEPLPAQAFVSVEGEGWQLIPLRTKPQTVVVDVTSERVELLEPVRQALGGISNVSISGVQPQSATVSFEQLISKRVPVRLDAQVDYAPMFGPTGGWLLRPDSVTLRGPQSKVEPVEEWWTDSLRVTQVDHPLLETLPLTSAVGSITLFPSRVQASLDVAEFTEDERRTMIRLSGVPEGLEFSLQPDMVSIRYLVPIEHFAQLKGKRLFEAFISYDRIISDATGFLEPEIVTLEEEIPLVIRSVNPPAVSYYQIVRE